MQPSHKDSDKSSQRLPVNPRRHKVPPEHRKRVATACNSCNLRRTKCSGDQPCTQCAAASRECVYPVISPKVSVSKAELEDLRHRVEAYERAFKNIIPDAEKRRELLGSRAGSLTPTTRASSPTSRTGAYGHQPLSPVQTEITGTTEEELVSPFAIEGHLLHDGVGTPRFHGETGEKAFTEELKSFLRGLLPLGEASTVPSSIGQCQTADSRPLPAPDANPLWLPPPNTTRIMLSVLRSFLQDGTDEQPSPSGGLYWFGNLTSMPSIPTSSGNVETDTRSARRLAFYQTGLALACRIASTKPSASGFSHDRSEPFFARATTLLGNPLDVTRCSMGEVSVLTMMAYYLLESDRVEAAYVYIGVASRVAFGAGAHRGNVDERGKRIFWTLYVLDRWVSCLLGRPTAIQDEALMLPLPVDSPNMPPSAGLHANVELARISDYITCHLYRIAATRENADTPASIRDKATFLLEQWHQNIPASLHLSPEGVSNDSAICALHMHANDLVIMIHRPALLKAVRSALSNNGSQSPSHAPQWESCIAAALRNMRLARHIATLHRPRRLLHAGLHFVFSAVLCFVLQSLLGSDDLTTAREVDFAVELFDREAQTGNTYGLNCANALRELHMLMAKRRGTQTAMEIEQAFEQHLIQNTTWDTPDMSGGDIVSLQDDVLSWMEHDWSFGGQQFPR